MTRIPAGARLLDLPCFTDGRGDLSFFEVGQHVPFDIADVAWVHPGPGSAGALPTGGGATFLVALRGSVTVAAPAAAAPLVLDRPDRALLTLEAGELQLMESAPGSCLLICSERPLGAAAPAADPAGPLRRIPTERTLGGTLVRGARALTFPVRRVYYLYNVPEGQERGAHAHRELHQLIVAVHGAFDVALDDGRERRRVRLDDSTAGLPVTRMVWRDLHDFTPDAVCLVLASETYSEADYIRTYEDYRRLVEHERAGSAPDPASS